METEAVRRSRSRDVGRRWSPGGSWWENRAQPAGLKHTLWRLKLTRTRSDVMSFKRSRQTGRRGPTPPPPYVYTALNGKLAEQIRRRIVQNVVQAPNVAENFLRGVTVLGKKNTPANLKSKMEVTLKKMSVTLTYEVNILPLNRFS